MRLANSTFARAQNFLNYLRIKYSFTFYVFLFLLFAFLFLFCFSLCALAFDLLFGCLLRLLTGVNIALGLEMLGAQARLAQTLRIHQLHLLHNSVRRVRHLPDVMGS